MSPTEPHTYLASRSFGSHGINQTHPQAQQSLQIPPRHQQQLPPTPTHTHSQPQVQLLPQPQGQPVNIQPRPAANGFSACPATTSPTASTSAPTPTGTGRKRGRPSKADKEAWARANASQPTGYAPISPAPIAPQPAPTQTQSTYSPSPVGQPAYQISPSAPASDPRPKKKGRPSAADKQRSESVPRSIQPIASSDLRDHHGTGEQDTRPEREGQDRRERAGHTGQRTPGEYQGPTPLEPPIHQSSTLNQYSGSPFAPGSLREGMNTPVEHTRIEVQLPVANHA